MKTIITIEVEVEYDATPPCRGARNEYGVPMEPDTPAEVDINSVKVGPHDVMNYIDEGTLGEIRDACFEDANAQLDNARESKAQYDDERWREQERQYE